MRIAVWVAWLFSAGLAMEAQLFKPDHAQANIDGWQGAMDVPAIENASSGWVPVRLPDCRVYAAPKTALHEPLIFPCNEWYLTPNEGTYLVWLATDDLVSSVQTILMARQVPYRGFGSVALHTMQPAGFVTIDGSVAANHVVKFLHLDIEGIGFSLRVSSKDVAGRFAIPPGRVVAGIFDSRDNAVAYSRPLTVVAGETTTFRVKPPDDGSDLLVVLRKPPGHRSGPPIELFVNGAVRKGPDVLLEQQSHVVAVWYGVPDREVTVSAASPKLRLEKRLELKAGTVSTLRAELTLRE